MTTHEKLRDKINELCPELMKLEFGCEVERSGELGIIVFCHGSTNLYRVKNGPWNEDDWNSNSFEILGKDPTLEDVMRAIDKDNTSNCLEFYTDGKCFHQREIESWDYKFTWELGKPLSKQSDETVEKILEILK